jgi:cephalosporin hydroxylase
MNRLSEIANKYTCDKGTEHYEKHGYTEVYDSFIPDKGSCTLLEIGVWHGDSLKMWKEYNPELNIHGVDVDHNVLNYIQSGDGITVHIGDGTKEEFLNTVLEKSGTPDFIIDDGSHVCEDIIATFEILYPKLKPGGCYFIEDLHAPHSRKPEVVKGVLEFLEGQICLVSIHSSGKLLIIEKDGEDSSSN